MEQQNPQPIQEKTETKPPIKTSWKRIVIATIIVSLVLLILWYVALLAEKGVLIPKSRTAPSIPQEVGYIESKEATDWESPLNLVECKEGTQRFLVHGLGSKSVTVMGKEEGDCVFEYTNEIEGGYTVYECRVPDMYSPITLSNFQFHQACGEIESGNFLLENQ